MRLTFTLLCLLVVGVGCMADRSTEDSAAMVVESTTSTTLGSEDIESMLRAKAAEADLTMDAERIATLKSRMSEFELVNGGFASVIGGGPGNGPCYCRGFDENGRYLTPCQCLWSTLSPLRNDS